MMLSILSGFIRTVVELQAYERRSERCTLHYSPSTQPQKLQGVPDRMECTLGLWVVLVRRDQAILVCEVHVATR